jgi:hypothetical protein
LSVWRTFPSDRYSPAAMHPGDRRRPIGAVVPDSAGGRERSIWTARSPNHRMLPRRRRTPAAHVGDPEGRATQTPATPSLPFLPYERTRELIPQFLPRQATGGVVALRRMRFIGRPGPKQAPDKHAEPVPISSPTRAQPRWHGSVPRGGPHMQEAVTQHPTPSEAATLRPSPACRAAVIVRSELAFNGDHDCASWL